MRNFLYKPLVRVCLFFAALVALMLGPVFFGLVLFPSDSDLVAQYYPLFYFYSQALHAGESFLWLPDIYSGFPIYLSQVAGFLDPVNVLIFSIFSGLDGMHVRLALDFFLTLVCSYAAARSLGLSRTASALVGPSYLLAFHWRFLSNPITANTLFLMPLLLYCITRALEAKRGAWKFVLLGGAGLGWAILGGYTQMIVYAVLFGGLFALGHYFLIESQKSIWRMIRVVYLYAAMLAVGVLLGLPQILPAAQFVPLTVRSDGIDYALVTLKVIDPGDLLLAVVPDYLYVPYVTAGRKPLFVGAVWFFLAAGAMVFALMSLALIRKIPLDLAQKRALLLTGLFIFALVAAFKWSPLFYLLHQLPVFEYFRFPFRFMFLGVFFLALLGGFGFDMLGRLLGEKAVRIVAYLFAAISSLFVLALACIYAFGDKLVLVLGSLLAFVGYGRLGLDKDPAHYRDALQRGIDGYQELLSFSDWIVLVPLLILLASAGAMWCVVRGTLSPTVFKKAAAALVVATFVVVFAAGWRWSAPAAALGAEGNVLTSFLTPEDKDSYRMYSFALYSSVFKYIPPQYKLSVSEEYATGELLSLGASPNTHLYTNMPSLDGYDQFMPAATLYAIDTMGGELMAGGVSSYGTRTVEERRDALLNNLDLFGMMGGKYIVSGVPLSHPSLLLLAMPRVTEYGIPLYVYEYAHPTPRFYLAKNIKPLPHQDFADLASKRGADFNSWVYLDCTACGSAVGGGTTKLLQQDNGAYRFLVDVSSPSYLVLSESNLPGWIATIDGASAPMVRANGLYMAVEVPPGQHEVYFEYRGMLGEIAWLRALNIVR